MEIPADLRYTAEDEWLGIDPDGTAVVGITDYAQDQLGDIVFVELPESGRQILHGEPFGVVESVKAVADLFMPVDGQVIARNEALEDAPELVNQEPYGDGWLIRIRPASAADVETLLTADAYRAQLPDDVG